VSGNSAFVISDILPYLCGILGLLLLWQYHQKQVLTGRIQATDIFDRSGIRMYVFATPEDGQICKKCWEANGMVLLPSQVANKDFGPRGGSCANSGRCTVVMAGLYGAWLEARNVVHRLQAAGRKGSLKLSAQELSELLKGNWEQSVSATTDRLAVLMLAALNGEKKSPDAAINAYRLAIREAKQVHDLPLVVPAYLRLAEVLVNGNQTDEALAVVQEFEQRYPRQGRTRPYDPTETQRGLMAIKKSRLKTASIGRRA
jgi:hypothetical protein